MTNFRKGNPLETEDLHWTAFCYVAGEMTPVQQDQFELRLEYDQTAREAVEGVVAEMQSLRLALEPQSESCRRLHTPDRSAISSSSTAKRRLRSLRLTATATLAIVLIGVTVFFFEPPSRTAPLAYLSPEVYLSSEKKSTTISRDLDPSESKPVAKESDLFEESDLLEWNEASWIMAIEDWNFFPCPDELDQAFCCDELLAEFDEQECFAADITEGFEWILEAFQAAAEDEKLEHLPLGWQSPNLRHFG